MATSTEIQALINTLAAKTAANSITPTEVAAIMSALNVNAAENYSTTETLTGGTWIDGKPIYRKAFIIISANNTIVHNLSIDRYINHIFYAKQDYYSSDRSNINYQTGDLIGTINGASNTLDFDLQNPNLGQYIDIVVLEYTKTTD